MVTFLGLNGHELAGVDAEVVGEFIALAGGSVPEDDLVDWIRAHTAKRRR